MKRRSGGQPGGGFGSGKRVVRRASSPLDMDRGRKRHRSFSPPGVPHRDRSPMDDRVGKPIIDKRQRRSHSGERSFDPGNKYDHRHMGITPEQRFAKFDNYDKFARYQRDMEKERGYEKAISRAEHYGKYEKESFEYSLRIGNLNYNISEKETANGLFQEFKRFGFIDVKVLGQRHDRHAFVNFIRYEDAKRARSELQNATLFGRGMQIEWSKSTLSRQPEFSTHKRSQSDYGNSAGHSSVREVRDVRDLRHSVRGSSGRMPGNNVSSGSSVEKSSALDPMACRTLFVGNLYYDVTERELRDLFSQYGRIESIDIKHQNTFHTSYAFIKFMTINDAINAKDDAHGRTYHNMEMKVGFGRGTQPGRVWCGNLTSYGDVTELEKLFDRYGTIRYVDFHEGDDHAFFHFDDADAAQTAIDSLSKHRFRSGLPLKIDWARTSKRDNNDTESEFRRHAYENDCREVLYEQTPISKRRHNIPDDSYGRKNSRTDSDYSGTMHRPNPRRRSPPPRFEKFTHRKKNFRSEQQSDHGQHFVFESDDIDVEPSPPPYKKQERISPVRISSDRETSGTHIFTTSREYGSVSRHDSGCTENSNKDVTENITSVTEPRSNGSGVSTIVDDKPISVSSSGGGFVEDEPNVKPDTTNPETLSDLAKHFPVAWKGCMVLKNTAFPTRMHLIGGDPGVAELLLRSKDDSTALLKISQRLRLEGPRLDEVNKRIQSAGPGGHCLLLAMSGPTPSQTSPERQEPTDLQQQTGDENLQFRPLKSLVTYLKQKQAAGIVALTPAANTLDEKGSSKNDVGTTASTTGTGIIDNSGVLHAFPPCDFSQSQLCRVAPSLGQEPCKEDHIVVVVVRGNV